VCILDGLYTLKSAAVAIRCAEKFNEGRFAAPQHYSVAKKESRKLTDVLLPQTNIIHMYAFAGNIDKGISVKGMGHLGGEGMEQKALAVQEEKASGV
ncbi:hypothetical protein Tco_1084448, partial [Tanacetum coccineum]